MAEYRSSYAETAFGLALDGKSDEEIAKHFAISLGTFYAWTTEHPKFGAAVEQGRSMADYMGLGEREFRDYRKQGGGYGISEGVGGGVSANWHVDGAVPSSGDGTSRATAFKTPQEAVDNASLAAGQSIAVYGGIYRGSVTLTKSGTLGSPIRMFAVGTDAIIEGGELLGGWVACTNQADALGSAQWANMYKAFVPSSIATNQLAYNLRQSSLPMYLPERGAVGGFATNDDTQNPKNSAKFATATGWTATTLTLDATTKAAYPSNSDLDNAYVLLHTSQQAANYVFHRKITAYNATTGIITFSTVDLFVDADSNPVAVSAALDGKFAILNAGLDLARSGQWGFKDAAEGDGTRKVVCYPLNPAAMADIQVTKRAFGLDIADESYWTIEGLVGRGFGGSGFRDGLAFGTYTNNSATKKGITFRSLKAQNPVNWYVSGVSIVNQPTISVESTTNEDITFEDCQTLRTMNMVGFRMQGARSIGRRNLASWPGSTAFQLYGNTDYLFYENRWDNVFGSHGNGVSIYQNNNWGIIARNIGRTEQGIGITIQESTNLLFLANDVQCPLNDVTHRAIENNSTTAPVVTGGVISFVNNTCAPAPTQVLSNSSMAMTIGKTGEVTFNAVNNVAHGGVDYALVGHGTNTVKGTFRRNVLTGKSSTQAATDAFFTTDSNSYRTTLADVLSDYASAIYLPTSEGPLDGAGEDPSSLLAPFRSHFAGFGFDFDKDANGAAVDWTTNPSVGAYKPAVALAFDRAPNAFSFVDRTGISVGLAAVASDPVQISGLVGQVWVAIASGSAANKKLKVLASDGVTPIDDWRAGEALLKSGQYLAVEGDASGTGNTAVTVVGQVGTGSDTFSITTTAATPYQTILDVGDVDDWWLVYDPSNPTTRTLSGANVLKLEDGLLNGGPSLDQSTNYAQFAANTFGQLDGITFTGSQRGLLSSAAFTALTQPYFIMQVMQDASISQASRYMLTAGTFEVFTRNASGNPVSATAGTILQFGSAKDTSPHIMEVLANGASPNSKIWRDGGTPTTGNMNTGTFAAPISYGQNASNINQWFGALGILLVFKGDPGASMSTVNPAKTKQVVMRELISSLTGIAVV